MASVSGAQMRAAITFSSILGNEHYDALEQILFFNPQQNKALSGIHHSVDEYGVPSIFVDGDRLRVIVTGLPGTQTLFALNELNGGLDVAGVMVYARTDPENIVLLHIAVKQEYTRSGVYADAMLVSRFMAQLREIARRLKGVRSITLKYGSGLTLPV
jgi:hypothetical protein